MVISSDNKCHDESESNFVIPGTKEICFCNTNDFCNGNGNNGNANNENANNGGADAVKLGACMTTIIIITCLCTF